MGNQLGPYELLGPIGRGGMGLVRRARRPGGPDVALKTVQADDALQVRALRVEIGALARLSHPGIARIVDHGVEEGRPWYAMELVPGLPLDAVLARRGWVVPTAAATTWDATPLGGPRRSAPTPSGRPVEAADGRLAEALSWVLALCDTLAWLHGEGLVHRDLKPSNVLIADGHRPVLVDFGLAARPVTAGRDRLEQRAQLVGSAAYMAPEQVQRRPVDARADLYALGCVLYELVCGRPPFAGPTEAVLHQHIGASHVPPSQRVAGVPEDLDDLLAELLEKDPRRRLAYADQIAPRLRALGASPPRPPGPEPRPYVYRPRLAGRTDELEAVEALLADHHVVLLGAESGTGKTRLAQELGARAGGRVEIAECLAAGADSPGALGGPLYPLRHLLSSSGVAEVGSAPGADRRLQILRALTEELTRTRSLLLLIDDLQWADGLTLEWIGYVARVAPDGLRILGTYRSEAPPPELEALRTDAAVADHGLAPLDDGAIADLVGDMLGMKEPPAGFTRFLAQQSRGSPFFVAEALRAAISESVLRRDSHGRWELVGAGTSADHYRALALPAGLAAVAARRIGGLSAPARALAGAAAVIGRHAPRPILEAICGPQGDTVAELVSRRVLQELEPGVLRFAHDQLREAAYTALPDIDRPALHRAVAIALEARGDDASPGLGHHWQRAGEAAPARAAYLRAASAAAEQHAPRDALRLYEAALALPLPRDEEALEARLALSEAAALLSAYGRAEEEARSAAELAEAAGRDDLVVRALRTRTQAALATGRLREARHTAGRALDAARRYGDERLLARCWLDVAEAARSSGRHDRAEQALAAAQGVAAGQADLDVDRLLERARLAYEQSAFHEARERYATCVDAARACGDPYRLGLALNGLANARVEVDRSTARAAYTEALEVHQRAGHRRQEGVVRANLAILAYTEGDLERADAEHLEGLAVLREVGERRYQGHALAYLARYARLGGRLQVAHDRATAAVGLLAAAGDPVWLPVPLEELAWVALARGRPAEAEAHARAALAVDATHPRVEAAALQLSDALHARGADGTAPLADPGPAAAASIQWRRARELLRRGDVHGAGALLDVPPEDGTADERARWWKLRAEVDDRRGADPSTARAGLAAALSDWPYPRPYDL